MPDREEEIRRISYHIWVLSKMPEGGPEQFRIVDERRLHRSDATQEGNKDIKGNEPSSSSPDEDKS
jgi:hypothetical protein